MGEIMIPDKQTNLFDLRANNNPQIQSELLEEEAIGNKIFALLNEHVSFVQKLSDEQLISWIPVLDKDCEKVHLFCHQLLKSDASVKEKSLKRMAVPLLKLSDRFHTLSDSRMTENIMNKVHSEILEVNETIQLKAFLCLQEELQDSIKAWKTELSAIKGGGLIDFSSKKYLAVLKHSLALISFYRQVMKQDISLAFQKNLQDKISKDLKEVAKVQKDIVEIFHDYLEKYFQCAKSQVEIDERGSQDFQESFAIFKYFNSNLKKAIKKMDSLSIRFEKEIAAEGEQRVPFFQEIENILTTLDTSRKALRKLSSKAVVKPVVAKKIVHSGIDVGKSWDSLPLRHIFRLQYPKMITQIDTAEAMGALKGWNFQPLTLVSYQKPTPYLRVNNLRSITLVAFRFLGKPSQIAGWFKK